MINAATDLANQTNNPFFNGYNFAQGGAAGAMGAFGVRERLPSFAQPNLVGDLAGQVAVDAGAQAASSVLMGR